MIRRILAFCSLALAPAVAGPVPCAEGDLAWRFEAEICLDGAWVSLPVEDGSCSLGPEDSETTGHAQTGTSEPPQISSVQGLIVNGSTVTILGSGFGNGPDVVLFDDFEAGTDGANIPVGFASQANVGHWSTRCGSGSCHEPYYSDEYARSGALAYVSDAGQPGSSTSGRNDLIVHVGSESERTRELFLYQWVYLPAESNCIPDGKGLPCNGQNWKQNWVLGPNESPTQNDRYGPWYMGSGDGLGQSQPSRFGSNADSNSYTWDTYEFRDSRWVNHQLWFYAGENPPARPQDGALGAWGIDAAEHATYETFRFVEGEDVQDNDEHSYATDPFRYYHAVAVGAYASRQTGPVGFAPRYDDVYVARGPNARARVLLANSSELSKATDLTICTTGAEGDNWLDRAIVCTVRIGSGGSGDAWAFVIDGEGRVSNGFGPLNWGEAASE